LAENDTASGIDRSKRLIMNGQVRGSAGESYSKGYLSVLFSSAGKKQGRQPSDERNKHLGKQSNERTEEHRKSHLRRAPESTGRVT
jgi:hypothetical protein